MTTQFLAWFRVDASELMGLGHMYRCLALAGRLRSHGAIVGFICTEETVRLCEHIKDFADRLVVLPPEQLARAGDCFRSESSHQLADAEQTLIAMSGPTSDLLVVDHYALDECWESQVSPSVRQLLVIDDLADRPHQCDYLLDANLRSQDDVSPYAGLVPDHTRIFAGAEYALLRADFDGYPGKRIHVRDEIRRVLIMFGGVDHGNMTGVAVDALSQLTLDNVDVDIVIGPYHPACDEIVRLAASSSFNVRKAVTNMAELMDRADLAIGGAGTASWERCAVGLPTVIVQTAPNQRGPARALEAHGAAINLGEVSSDTGSLIAGTVQRLFENPSGLKSMSLHSYEIMQKRVDVAEIIVANIRGSRLK